MKILRSAIGLAVVLSFAAVGADATPINPFNVRPVPVGTAPGAEAQLQTIVDAILGGGLDVDVAQSTAGMWGMATFPPTTIPTLAFEYTANAGTQSFGIWFGSDDSSLYSVEIFNGTATGSNNGGFTAAGLSFSAPGTLDIFSSNCAKVNCGSFVNPLVTPTSFGFYWQNGPTIYYTVDSLNPADEARALAFAKGTNWAIAFEDGTGGLLGLGDNDYNDIVVKVESIQAVPEPASLALLGAGLLGLAVRARRRH